MQEDLIPADSSNFSFLVRGGHVLPITQNLTFPYGITTYALCGSSYTWRTKRQHSTKVSARHRKAFAPAITTSPRSDALATIQT